MSSGSSQPVTLAFDIDKDKSHFRLMGQVQTTLELVCSRCLEPYTMAVAPLVRSALPAPHGEYRRGRTRNRRRRPLDGVLRERDDKSGQLMREQFYLVLPMKPLCREECLGLCSVCGTNLNRGTCTCQHAWEDPRLAVLKALKKNS